VDRNLGYAVTFAFATRSAVAMVSGPPPRE
jgi:hypothetical protein